MSRAGANRAEGQVPTRHVLRSQGALYERVDALEKDIDSGLEEVLEGDARGFALLKETARGLLQKATSR